MSSLNKILLVGHIDSDIQSKESVDGQPLLRFTLLVERPTRSDGMPSGEDRMPTIIKGALAEKQDSLSKGDLLSLEGRIITGKQTLEDGRNRYFTEVEAISLKVISQQSKTQAAGLKTQEEMPAANLETHSTPLETKEEEPLNFSFDTTDTEDEMEETVPF